MSATIARIFAPRSRAGRRARFDRIERDARARYAEGRFDLFDAEIDNAARAAREAGQTEDFAEYYDRLGELMEAVGMYSRALPFLEEALQVREELYGRTDYRIAASLNNLALLHYVRGAFDQAEVGFLRLRELLEQTAPRSRELLTCTDNYAAVLRKQKRESEAAEVAQAAKVLKAELDAEKNQQE